MTATFAAPTATLQAPHTADVPASPAVANMYLVYVATRRNSRSPFAGVRIGRTWPGVLAMRRSPVVVCAASPVL